jgi:hypothetical protein
MVERNGREFYEVVRFASVTRPDGTVDDHINHVGACFAEVDAETRRTLAQSQALSKPVETEALFRTLESLIR